jgi:glucose/arabinose dehydrogenase
LKGYRLVLLLLVPLLLAGCNLASSLDATTPAPLLTADQPADAITTPAPTLSQAPPATEQLSSSATPSFLPTSSPTIEPIAIGTALPDVQVLPDPGEFIWELVVDGLDRPVGLVQADDNSGRLFVLEQAGTIRVIENGALQPEPFLDIRSIVGSQGNEQGLLGMAFHPRFAENGYFFINYTDLDGNTNITRFSASPDNPEIADPQSEVRLLFIDQPYQNHNGGSVVFGPDGYLYLGLGDGGSAGDPQGNAQSTGTYLGKILRLDVDGGDPYAIPADNPFADGGINPQGGLAEIWAYGLRNPWRFSFDNSNGDVYIADVGQGSWEEVNYLPLESQPGANYGWVYREGRHPYEGSPPEGAPLVDPVEEYDHGQGCSVTGGYVYRGRALPEWQGVYLFGDYCSGIIWGLLRNTDGSWRSARLFETSFNISSFGEDIAGEIYLADLNGAIYRLTRRP